MTDTFAEIGSKQCACLLYTSPAVLDEFGNSTEKAYTGWPDRIYLIDSQGHVAYKSAPGPFGFKPDQLEAVLSRTTETSK